MKNGHAIFFRIEDLNTQAIFCDFFFSASTHQKLQRSRRKDKTNVQGNRNQQLHQLKKDNIGDGRISELSPYVLAFYFNEIGGFSCYLKQDP